MTSVFSVITVCPAFSMNIYIVILYISELLLTISRICVEGLSGYITTGYIISPCNSFHTQCKQNINHKSVVRFVLKLWFIRARFNSQDGRYISYHVM